MDLPSDISLSSNDLLNLEETFNMASPFPNLDEISMLNDSPGGGVFLHPGSVNGSGSGFQQTTFSMPPAAVMSPMGSLVTSAPPPNQSQKSVKMDAPMTTMSNNLVDTNTSNNDASFLKPKISSVNSQKMAILKM